MSMIDEEGGGAHPSSPPSSIRAIKKGDVHRITSGQVVLDIQSAVKELIENALDASATTIEVRFKEYGADLIEVIDNGSGIESSNYDSLALKHHTSKLQDFADLIRVTTFGFRGEALSSLCELAKVQFITATQSEDPVGTILDMNRDGTIQSRDRKVARKRGTTVSVSDLFYTLPVRRKELVKNVKREFAKAQALLQAYAIISSGVRWIVSNTVKGKKNTIMTIPASPSATHLSSNVAAVFGPKVAPDLVPLDLQLSLSSIKRRSAISSRKQMAYDEDEDEVEGNGSEQPILRISGLVSRPSIGCGRTSSDRCFLYVNGRPWDSPKI
jgi:DNA mismatch repair protein PMS2